MASVSKLIQLQFTPNQATHLGNDSEYFIERTSWTPTWGTDSGWTTGSVTATCKYWREGKLYIALIDVTLTLTSDGGAAPTNITFTLPAGITPQSVNHFTQATLRWGGANQPGHIAINNGGGSIARTDGTAWGAGANNGVQRTLAWWEVA